MRPYLAAGLSSVALMALAACSKPAPPSGAPAASSAPPVAAAAPPASGPLSPQDLPHRKPGLWRQTMSMEGVDRTMPAMELCLDAASEAKMSMLGQQTSQTKCQNQQFSRNLDGTLTFTATCDAGGGQTVSTGKITGDFNSSYTMEIDSKTTGAPEAAMNGEHKMTISAAWVGPCAPGQKGGDMIMPGGMKMNMGDLAKRGRQ